MPIPSSRDALTLSVGMAAVKKIIARRIDPKISAITRRTEECAATHIGPAAVKSLPTDSFPNSSDNYEHTRSSPVLFCHVNRDGDRLRVSHRHLARRHD